MNLSLLGNPITGRERPLTGDVDEARLRAAREVTRESRPRPTQPEKINERVRFEGYVGLKIKQTVVVPC